VDDCCLVCLVAWHRAPRYTPSNHKLCRTISDADAVVDLRQLFTAFDIAEQCQRPLTSPTLTEAADSNSFTRDTTPVELNDDNLMSRTCRRNVEVMLECFGFAVERRPSTLKHGGIGVLVTHGTVPAGHITSLYPGIVLSCIYM